MAHRNPLELLSTCASRRDPEAWREFLERFACRLLYGVQRALRRGGIQARREELEDFMQDVYCRLLEKGGRNLRTCRGREERAVGAYLGTIAERVVIDKLRAASAAKRGRHHLAAGGTEAPIDLEQRAVDPRLSPEDRALANERRRLFWRRCRSAVGSRSPARNVRVLYLAVFEGWSSREISRRLGGGLTPGNVDSLVHRMKRRLARQGMAVPRR